ncbi:hypothetical protein EDD36DRAFT_137179 [Exophiala viscosa]|uniref:Uncharacterized protein n=1 Tax=Exophiala viscosa TaxID=2486360 RepID=A0AAN6E241_9EURO|nr:hypothetical protein EDD36DRAFT_137179 [Exophiala viscosa]
MGQQYRAWSTSRAQFLFHKLEAHSVDDVDGIHIFTGSALPTGAEKIPDDCLPFEHALLAFSQLVPFDGTWAHGEEDGPSTWAVVALLRDHIWPTHAEVISFYHTAPLPDIYCVTLTLSGLGPAIPASSTRDQSASIHGSSVSGLKLLRKSGTLHGPIAQSTFLVREYRKTLCVRLFPNRHQHRLFYSIVTITDEADRWFGYHTHDLTQRELASTYKPLYVYLSFVSKILRSLQEDWTEVLDRFNNEINVTLEQISTVPGLNDLLFDDRGLSTSRRYFVLLQHLRIYEEWIVGTSDGLMVWYEVCRSWLEGQNSRFEIELKKPGLSKECEGVLIAWKKLVKDSQAAFGPLLDRIRTKRQEVVTLRDGLFNATAVREALQGSRLNQQGLRLNRYVFIFTITTIIYLPLTFVTGFLGMNDLPFKMKNSMMPLSWMIIAFCLGTYLITFGSLGIYALSEKIKQKKPDDLHRQQESSANHKVDGDGTIGEARKRKEPPAASKGRQGSTGAPGNLVRRATDALSNAIPLKQRRSWRKKRADVPSQV